jgi:hypothetical protein
MHPGLPPMKPIADLLNVTKITLDISAIPWQYAYIVLDLIHEPEIPGTTNQRTDPNDRSEHRSRDL